MTKTKRKIGVCPYFRKAKIKRETTETKITTEMNLDRPGPVSVKTTVPFMDHMLNLFARHSGFSLVIKAKGDTEIDDHHLVEDIGITLGQAIEKALGKKRGITRYGNFLLPMDEALSYVAVDLSGRPYLEYDVRFKFQKQGFDFDLLKDFFYSLAINARITLHIEMKKGANNHHIAESVFKGFARALSQAVAYNIKQKGIPSTKGRL
ncbi:MAG: imidazoleglycerol-phosphate dehydratase HisB [Endomicrobiales bacterium]|nr:imidazoleglycerol-phosphate dehydratase HisB [Endomicrobiales bacterium]